MAMMAQKQNIEEKLK